MSRMDCFKAALTLRLSLRAANGCTADFRVHKRQVFETLLHVDHVITMTAHLQFECVRLDKFNKVFRCHKHFARPRKGRLHNVQAKQCVHDLAFVQADCRADAQGIFIKVSKCIVRVQKFKHTKHTPQVHVCVGRCLHNILFEVCKKPIQKPFQFSICCVVKRATATFYFAFVLSNWDFPRQPLWRNRHNRDMHARTFLFFKRSPYTNLYRQRQCILKRTLRDLRMSIFCGRLRLANKFASRWQVLV